MPTINRIPESFALLSFERDATRGTYLLFVKRFRRATGLLHFPPMVLTQGSVWDIVHRHWPTASTTGD